MQQKQSTPQLQFKPSSEKSYESRPWHFDPETKQKAELKNGKNYVLIPAADKDFKKVNGFYQHYPVPGYGIRKVEVIYNQWFNFAFEAHLNKLQSRDNNPSFTPKWSNMLHADLRQAAYDRFIHLTQPYTDPNYPAVKLLPVWHGTSPQVLDSLFSAGYANLATTDKGFFGKGYYSAYEAEYSYRVYSKGALILNWVASFSPLPIVNNDMKELALEGKSNYGRYDAHFVPVRPRDPNNSEETVYYPCRTPSEYCYTEIVVFESAALLPVYLVELQPEGLGLKSPLVLENSSILLSTEFDASKMLKKEDASKLLLQQAASSSAIVKFSEKPNDPIVKALFTTSFKTIKVEISEGSPKPTKMLLEKTWPNSIPISFPTKHFVTPLISSAEKSHSSVSKKSSLFQNNIKIKGVIRLAELCALALEQTDKLQFLWKNSVKEYWFKISVYFEMDCCIFVFSANNLEEDIGILETLPEYYSDALKEMKTLEDSEKRIGLHQAIEKYSQGQEIIFTGFSIAAGLAELAACYYGKKAITFESPGIEAILSRLKIPYKDENIITYLTVPNHVNTFGKHAGAIKRIYITHVESTSNWHRLKAIWGEMDRVSTYLMPMMLARSYLFKAAAQETLKLSAMRVDKATEILTTTTQNADKLFGFAIAQAKNAYQSAASNHYFAKETLKIAENSLKGTSYFFATYQVVRQIRAISENERKQLINAGQHSLPDIVSALKKNENEVGSETMKSGHIIEIQSWPTTLTKNFVGFFKDVGRSYLPLQPYNPGILNINDENSYIEANINLIEGYQPKL